MPKRCKASNRLNKRCGTDAMRFSMYCQFHREERSILYRWRLIAKRILKKKWKTVLGAITVIGFILALYSFFISPSKKEMEKLISVENKKVIEYINRNPKDSIESLQQKALFKKTLRL